MIRFKPLFTTLTLVAGLACSFSSWALNITASVSKTSVSKDEIIQLKVAADEKLDGGKINFDTLSDNFYVGRPSFSSSVNIINGKRSDSSVWTVSIAPQKTGSVTIPSFKIDDAITDPITLNVGVGEQVPTTTDIIEVRSKIGKKELYPNESTQLDARIIVKVDPRRLQNPNLTQPIASGLKIEPLSEPQQYQAVLDGVEVLIIDQKFRVTASNSGDFSIKLPTLTGAVRYGNNRSSTRIINLDGKSPTVSLTVLPVPENYQGAWLPTSKLDLSQSWQLDNNEVSSSDSVTIEEGDSLTRTITLTATGLGTSQLPNLTINNPDAFRVYSEKPAFSDNDDGSVTMTTKQVLIAKRSGEFSLPNVPVQWWDSVNKKAQTSEVKGLNVTVNASASSASAPLLPQSPTTNTQIVKDSGFWPILTALFACLWVFSTVMWLRGRKQSPSVAPSVDKAKTLSLKSKLIEAIEQGDPIKAQSLLEQWLTIQEVDLEDAKAIRAEMNLMSQKVMGAEPSTWDKNTLVNLIKQAKTREKYQTEELARL
ncbi:BatD family protein [Vibrio comitans]|nr:BatD family protein [Vibrio comitans]